MALCTLIQDEAQDWPGRQTGLLLPGLFSCCSGHRKEGNPAAQFPSRSCLGRASGVEDKEAFGTDAVHVHSAAKHCGCHREHFNSGI